MAKKAPAARAGRRKKAEPRSRGLAARECRDEAPGSIAELIQTVEAGGGTVLASYREPLGGEWTLFAVLPIEKVSPTPFQRDLSESHAKRLSETIGRMGRYLDPIIAVCDQGRYWTPNGRHRLEAMTRLGARAVTALVLPDPAIQYKILALNVEKAHNLREKALEVVRMYRALAAAGGGTESGYGLEFEEPSFATLGICYERNGRFAGGAYQPILKRVDDWIEQPLAAALKIRERRACRIEALDVRVSAIVKDLQTRGFKNPYLRAFVVSRVNPLRFMKTMPPFEEAIDDILKRAERFDGAKVKQEDLASTAGAAAEEG